MGEAEDEIYSIRITSHGKIKKWVSYALQSFQEHPDTPLSFHTLPKTTLERGKASGEPCNFASSMALAPRLITVVEIVKREFQRIQATDRSPRLKGLHQYNEICTLESEPAEGREQPAGAETSNAQQARSERIIEALSGKNHVRITQTPYMRITLSLVELPSLQARGATYQPPSARKLTKSAQARARKRAQKEEAGAADPDAKEKSPIATDSPKNQ